MAMLSRVNQANDLRVQALTKQITTADLTDSDQQQQFDFDDTLPATALVVGCDADVETAFTDGGVGTATADLGIKDGNTDGFLDAVDLSTAVARLSVPRGDDIPGAYEAETPTIIVDGTVNLDTFTAGDVTFSVYYIDLANIGS